MNTADNERAKREAIMNDPDPYIRTLKQIAVGVYADEPCRICGVLLTYEDLLNGAVFAGYSADSKSRAAHKACWDAGRPKEQWAYPNDANSEDDQ